jgi:3-methyladenine DNA glycosylase AlkD
MTRQEALQELQALADPAVLARNSRADATDNQFGVKLGDIRKLAKRIKSNHELGLELWATGNVDAQLLGTLVIKPRRLSSDELDALVRSLASARVADWLNAYVVKKHPDKEQLRLRWMTDSDPMAARAGWSLTNERVVKSPEGLDLSALLDRIEAEMGSAPPVVQWTMNFVLGETGIRFPEHRARARSIGEALGVYRDYPVSKGCTSPFVPLWIDEMVRRQG